MEGSRTGFQSENLTLDVESGVALITLNRPQVLNALDQALSGALVRAVERCAEDPEVRSVVITGAGRAFCAGGDMKPAYELLGKQPARYFRDLTKLLHRLVADLRLIPKPVVAAINGPAVGAGMSLALACDLRLISEGAFMKQAYTSIGLCPDGGWSSFVPGLAGGGRAAELVFLDEPVSAQQALAWGLVNRLVPGERLLGEALDVAGRLASGPATSYARAKELLNQSLWPGLETQLERERQFLMACAESVHFAERVRALMERRLLDRATGMRP